jgi:diguanylate cyclase (GGDEF)-like protein/PAS domain S-box-containing protein
VLIILLIFFTTPIFADEYSILDEHSTVVLGIDPETGVIHYANKAASDFYFYSLDELVGMNIKDINTLSAIEVEGEMERAKKEERTYYTFVHELKTGERRIVDVYTHPVIINDQALLFSFIHDVTEEHYMEQKYVEEQEKIRKVLYVIGGLLLLGSLVIIFILILIYNRNRQLKFLTSYDSLTGVENRHTIRNTFNDLVTTKNIPIAFFMIDVNNLKLINDAFGHVIGDEMIIETAKMIQEKTYNGSKVGRVSGDEFVVVVPSCGAASAQPLEEALRRHMINLLGIDFSVAVGYTMVTEVKANFESVFSKAESNMYHNKATYKEKINKRIIGQMLKKLYSKEPYYVKRVEPLSQLLNVFKDIFNLSAEELEWLVEAAKLQDIGIIVDDDSEGNHVNKTYSILNALHVPTNISNICYYHHERFDGKGYPKGVIGNNIPKLGRLLILANTIYDYNERLESGFIAISELRKISGSVIDPSLFNSLNTEAFLKFLDSIR